MLEKILTIAFITGLFCAAVRMAVPILLAALGEIFSELSGVLNIGIEGSMLSGALAGFLGTYYTGSIFWGVMAGICAGAVMGLIMAFLSVTLQANQVACGIILNLFALGFTSFLFRIVFGVTLMPPSIKALEPLPVPLLKDIPFFGPVLFQQNILVYITFILVILCSFILYRTYPGLKIRAAGEKPDAADTMGVNVCFTRYICVIVGSMFAGLGGAFLSMELGMFIDNMTAGRGFIALAAVIFGRWSPGGALGASLLFGFADAFQLRLQSLGVSFPHELLLMLPYILTIVMLTGVVGKSHSPSALTVPYKSGE